MSMKQIETLVVDYGGVIVNIDDASVVKAMESLGVTAPGSHRNHALFSVQLPQSCSQ